MNNEVVVLGRGHSGTRGVARWLKDSGFLFGVGSDQEPMKDETGEVYRLNATEDFVYSPGYHAARLAGGSVIATGPASWDFSPLADEAIPFDFHYMMDKYEKPIRDEAGGKPWGFKLPELTLALPWLLRQNPDRMHILVVRHPLDTVLKAHGTDNIAGWGAPTLFTPGSGTLMERLYSWYYHYAITIDTIRLLSPKNLVVFRLRDLVYHREYIHRILTEMTGMELPLPSVKTTPIGRWLNYRSTISHRAGDAIAPVVNAHWMDQFATFKSYDHRTHSGTTPKEFAQSVACAKGLIYAPMRLDGIDLSTGAQLQPFTVPQGF